MILNFEDLPVPVYITKEEQIASKNTDNMLTLLHVSTIVKGREANDHFLELVEKAKVTSISSQDETGQPLQNWKVKNITWNYRDNENIYFHNLELEEVEEQNRSEGDVDSIGIVSFSPWLSVLNENGPINCFAEIKGHSFDDDSIIIVKQIPFSIE